MAFDPKSRRVSLHYTGGRVTGCLGLIDYLFTGNTYNPISDTTTDSLGRVRLKNLIRRVSAVGGKQIMIICRDGKEYMLHYSGTFKSFVFGAVPRLDRSVVVGYSTVRGSKQYIL